MNPSDPGLVDLLAAEYVLGTLRGAARARFERQLTADAAARSAVAEWEGRLAPLADRIVPVEPRPGSWRQIALRCGIASARPVAGRRWRAAPVALAAVLVLLAVGVALWVRQPSPEFTSAAIVATSDGRPLWRVDLTPGRTQMRIEVAGAIDTPAGKDFELWALPEGGAPVSLGLLPPNGRTERALGERQRAALASARRVAVSIEPRGGSPTGAPTGPVVHVAPIKVAATTAPKGAQSG
jgi:anti-sigma-K factor RskA